MAWGNQSTLTQQEVKVPIIDFKRGDRILLDNGTVAIVTGYKTKQYDGGRKEPIMILEHAYKCAEALKSNGLGEVQIEVDGGNYGVRVRLNAAYNKVFWSVSAVDTFLTMMGGLDYDYAPTSTTLAISER